VTDWEKEAWAISESWARAHAARHASTDWNAVDARELENALLGFGREMAEEAREAEQEKWQRAQSALSHAYLRLRKLIPGALQTAYLSATHVWEHTEECLRKLLGAADARAEEIARLIERMPGGFLDEGPLVAAASVARSTISKPAPVVDFSESKPWEQPQRAYSLDSKGHPWTEAAIRADERENLITLLYELGYDGAAERVEQKLKSRASKTREDVLEEALRKIRDWPVKDGINPEHLMRHEADRALWWKP